MSGHCRPKRDGTRWPGLQFCADFPDEGVKIALHLPHIVLEPDNGFVNALEFAVLHEYLITEFLPKSMFLLRHKFLEPSEVTAMD
jgi:hypothetical protein